MWLQLKRQLKVLKEDEFYAIWKSQPLGWDSNPGPKPTQHLMETRFISYAQGLPGEGQCRGKQPVLGSARQVWLSPLGRALVKEHEC